MFGYISNLSFFSLAMIPTEYDWGGIENCNLPDCVVATNSEFNQRILSMVLYTGNYKLIIFDNADEQMNDCVPYSFGFKIEAEFPSQLDVRGKHSNFILVINY